ncbi:MAG: hypothetical protein R3274_03460 [Desulfobacterales bacterium]|nr:hypothetical protein [Desulfobacterales bacterium]
MWRLHQVPKPGETFGWFSDRIIREDQVGQTKKLEATKHGNRT